MNKIINKIVSVSLCLAMCAGIFNFPVYANGQELPAEELISEDIDLQYLIVEKPYVAVNEKEKIYVSFNQDVPMVQLSCFQNGQEVIISGKKVQNRLYVFEQDFQQEGEVILSSMLFGENYTIDLKDVSLHVSDVKNSNLPEIKSDDTIFVYGKNAEEVKNLLVHAGVQIGEDVSTADYVIQIFGNESEAYYLNESLDVVSSTLNLNSVHSGDEALAEYYVKDMDAQSSADTILASLNEEQEPLQEELVVSNLEDGKYTIHLSESSDYVIDVRWGSKENGANIHLYTINGTTAQIWNVVHDTDGNLSFICENSNKALSLHGNNIVQLTYTKADTQKWKVLSDGRISSISNPELYIDYEGNTPGNVVNIYVSENGKEFRFKKYDPKRDVMDAYAKSNASVLSDGKYTIRSARNNTYGIRMDASNAELFQSSDIQSHAWQVIHDKQGYVSFINIQSQEALTVDQADYSQNVYGKKFEDTYNQKWIILSDGTIVSALDKKFVLDLHYGTVKNKSNVQIYESNGTLAQKWKFIRFDENRKEINDLAQKNQGNIANGNYAIYTKTDSEYVVDVRWGSTSQGANVQLYTDNGTTAQRWKASHDENGYVIFTCINSGKVLASNGNNIEQQIFANTYDQKWIVLSDGTIMSAADSSMFMSYEGDVISNGLNIGLGAGKEFGFKKYDPKRDVMDAYAKSNASVLSDGKYFIQSGKNTNYGLSVFGNNAVLSEITESKGQLWSISHDESGYVIFTNVYTNEILSVSSNEAKDSQNVELRVLDDSYAQKWIVLSDGTIVSALDKKFVLDLHYGIAADGSNIQLYTSNGTLAQKWNFKEYDELRMKMNEMAQENINNISDGHYVIQLQQNLSYVMDIQWQSISQGANVQLYTDNGSLAQRWKISHDKKGYVILTNLNSNKVLTVNGNNVEQASSKDSYAQKWIVLSDGVIMSAVNSDLYLGFEGEIVSDGTNLSVCNKPAVFAFSQKKPTGFVEEDGNLYYYDLSGNLLTGNFNVGKVSYFANPNGKILSSKVNYLNYLSQKDSRWANQVVGYWYFGSTGCVPTVIAMYMNYLNKEEKTPLQWGLELHEHGYYNVNYYLGTQAEVWRYVSEKYGLTVSTNMTYSQLRMTLLQGKIVAAAVNPGKFCPYGYTHEILIHSMDAHGNVFVEDPLVPGNRCWYPLDKLYQNHSTEPGDWYDKSDGRSSFITLQ